MGCGVCRTQVKLEEPIPVAPVTQRPVEVLSQENLDTLTKGEERVVVIQTRLNPEEESVHSEEQRPIDSYGIYHSENFGNAREDTEVVLDAPAAVKKKPETPEGPRVPSPKKPLKPLIPDVLGHPAPRAAFKPSEKPLFELPKIEKPLSEHHKDIPRLPSDLLLVEPTAADIKQDTKVTVGNTKEETLDQLLRDIEAM